MTSVTDEELAERFRELVSYDPASGQLRWKVQIPGQAGIGSLAGSYHSTGRVYIKLDRKRYMAHRVIWLMMTGRWPRFIDHIDHCPTNNQWANLRECSQAENQRNVPVRKDSSTKIRGVFPLKNGRYYSRIRVDGKRIHLGTFATKELAAAAYAGAARELHGEFACL